MRIEDEIKSSFPDVYQKTMVNIYYTANWLNYKNAQLLKEYGLSIQQYNILRILRGAQKPCSILTLTQRMLDKSSNASRLVDKLKQKKLVSRVTNKQDRRAVLVSITDKGLELLKELDDKMKQFSKTICHISDEKLQELNMLLDELRN